LGGEDLNNTERNLIFEVTPGIADACREIEVQVRVLAPLGIAIQKLTIEPVSANAISNSPVGKNAIVRPGTSLDFGPSGRAPFYQSRGWSYAEDLGTWTDGPHALLNAKLVRWWPPDDMIFQMTARPFLVQDRNPSLAVDIVINGAVVDRWSYR